VVGEALVEEDRGQPATFDGVYRAAELVKQVRQECGLPDAPPASMAHCIEA
jgi:hypothetical protein